MSFTAFVSWPSAPLTDTLVRKSLARFNPPPVLTSTPTHRPNEKLLQWSTYDNMDHELTLSDPDTVLSSSYTIRKVLIRKHFLHRCIIAYVTKYPLSRLKISVPQTWDIEISFADELDELWSDELWDLAEELQNSDSKWWILKPGMADRGMGIRLFNSKESLRDIFESFEGDSDSEEISEDENSNIITSHLRHFVIQEYLATPLLLDPSEIPIRDIDKQLTAEELQGHKFHLRAYCVAAGSLTLYLYPRILALFSSKAYIPPSCSTENLDLTPHLTNTCLQQHRGEEGVRLFEELVGCRILSIPLSGANTEDAVLTSSDIKGIVDQVADILGETFRAALQLPVHFQPLPNAFELYGADFLVTFSELPELNDFNSTKFNVKLLEINAEPAIEMTGPRLTWVLEELFLAMGEVCVRPSFNQDTRSEIEMWEVGETKYGLRKCLEVRSLHGC